MLITQHILIAQHDCRQTDNINKPHSAKYSHESPCFWMKIPDSILLITHQTWKLVLNEENSLSAQNLSRFPIETSALYED